MGRPLKRQKSELEKLIKRVWRETNGGRDIRSLEEAIIMNAIRQTLDFLETLDYINDNGFTHAEVFSAVYLSEEVTSAKVQSLLFEAGLDFIKNEPHMKDILEAKKENAQSRVMRVPATIRTRENLANIFYMGILLTQPKDKDK